MIPTPDKEVTFTFTINEKGAPVIRVIHDKESDGIKQKLLGLLLKNAKSNSNQIVMEKIKEYADGVDEYEFKVMGT